MRINTDGKKEFRNDLYQWTADVFDESTKVGGIDAACRHAQRDFENKQAVIQVIETHCSGKVARELAEALSTPQMPIEYEFSTRVGVEGAE